MNLVFPSTYVCSAAAASFPICHSPHAQQISEIHSRFALENFSHAQTHTHKYETKMQNCIQNMKNVERNKRRETYWLWGLMGIGWIGQ